jgi:hypothetical protein
MLEIKAVKNEKPRDLAATKPQGNGTTNNSDGKNTTLPSDRARYERGLELCRQGRVSIAPNGDFLVNGYLVDTERVKCECPDHKTWKGVCKHYYAARVFQKNGCNVVNGKVHTNVNGNGTKSAIEPKHTTNNVQAHYKGFDRQATITRVAVLNTATEILKTHNRQISFDDVVALAGRLEAWALGS